MAAMETTIAKDCAILGFRDVLVSQDESDASVHALVYADMLCSAFGGHLTGLMFGLVPFYPMSAANVRVPEAWIHAQRQASEEAEQSERRIKAIYGKLASRNELRRVDAFEQEAGQICARHARCADLTVLGWSRDGGADLERARVRQLPVRVRPAAAGRARRLCVPRPAATRAGRLGRQPRSEPRAARGAADPASGPADALRRRRSRRFGRQRRRSTRPPRSPAISSRHEIAVETRRAHSRGRDVATALAEEADHFGASLWCSAATATCARRNGSIGDTTRGALALARTPMLFAN